MFEKAESPFVSPSFWLYFLLSYE